jgi:hypothetical protein
MRRTIRVEMRLSEDEYRCLREQAGPTPLGTWIRKQLCWQVVLPKPGRKERR